MKEITIIITMITLVVLQLMYNNIKEDVEIICNSYVVYQMRMNDTEICTKYQTFFKG